MRDDLFVGAKVKLKNGMIGTITRIETPLGFKTLLPISGVTSIFTKLDCISENHCILIQNSIYIHPHESLNKHVIQ